jgi:N-acetylglucosaminyl-diphospho-decaprenol L-rhamnosyltransferase
VAERPLVTIVVVTYNSSEDIAACLDSALGELPDDGSEVVVLDNASSDGTAELVEQRWPQVHLVRSPENLGFARACNRAAAVSSSRFVLLLNPDAVMLPGCLAALVDVARRHPDGGLYGGRVLDEHGAVDRTSCWGRPTLWSTFCFATGLSTAFASSVRFNPEGIGSWARDVERHVDIVSGCLLLADRDAWERLGGFDERFFMYGEDFDLGIRAAAAGYRPMITPAAGITHVGGASSAAVDMEIMLYRGKVSLVGTLWQGPRRRLAELLLLTGVAVRARLATVVRRVRGAGEGSRTAPSTWSALWGRRDEWRGGWPPPT